MKTISEHLSKLKLLSSALAVSVCVTSFFSGSVIAQPYQQDSSQSDSMNDNDEDMSDDVDRNGNSSAQRFNEWQPGQFRPEPEVLRRAVQNEAGGGNGDSVPMNGGGEFRQRRNEEMNGAAPAFERGGMNGPRPNSIGINQERSPGNGAAEQGGPVSNQGPRLHDVDAIITNAMQQYAVPGASIAIAYQGRLVYVKAYGVANIRTNEPVSESTFFNLGSCTKAVSMFGTLRLQEQGKLNLDDTVYNVIGQPPLPRRQCDPRVFQITVRQLLHHSGGWNDDSGFIKAGKEVRRIAPNGMPYKEAVRVLFMTPLDYAPGTQAKYANGQWNLIKYVIACAAQMPYREYMRAQLASIGITDMHNESEGHVDGEATRYTGNPPKVYPSGQRNVPLEPAFGNWMATSVDMVKFMTALDGSRIQGISRESYQQMIAPLPPPMVNEKDGSHFGLGMDIVRETDKGTFFSKNGAKPGVHCQIVHLPIGVDFCIMMNGGGQAADGSNINPMPIGKIAILMNSIQEWPDRDLFPRFQDAAR